MSADSLPFYYVIVVWGEEYVDSLLRVTLPCLLAPGNLPALSNLNESRLVFLTTPEDAARIQASPVFARLKEWITPLFPDCPWLKKPIPYHLKAARGHQEAAKLAIANHGLCIYLAPDFVLSDGSLSYLLGAAEAGKEAVMIAVPRVVRETFFDDLGGRGLFKPGEPLPLSSRELVAIALDHLHEDDQRYNWDHEYFSVNPVVCTWNVPGEKGLLVHSFHLHPIMVSMRGDKDLSWLERETIDGEFLAFNIDREKIVVESDSDHIAMFSFTKKHDRLQPLIPTKASIEHVGRTSMLPHVNPLHKLFFMKAIMLHTADLNEQWWKLKKETDRLVYQILKNSPVGVINSIPAKSIFRHLLWRIGRRIRSIINPPRDQRTRAD